MSKEANLAGALKEIADTLTDNIDKIPYFADDAHVSAVVEDVSTGARIRIAFNSFTWAEEESGKCGIECMVQTSFADNDRDLGNGLKVLGAPVGGVSEMSMDIEYTEDPKAIFSSLITLFSDSIDLIVDQLLHY